MLKVLHQILMTVLAQGFSRNVFISDINGTAQSGRGRVEEGGGDTSGAAKDWSVQGGDHSSKAAWVWGGIGPQGARGWVPALHFVIAELPQIFALNDLLPTHNLPQAAHPVRQSHYSR